MAIGRASATLRRLSRGPRRRHAGRSSPAGREWGFRHVNVGNPQCVIEVGDEARGARPRRDRARRSSRTRAVPEPHQRLVHPRRRLDAVRARIFERGVGETLSSGTGASGAAVAAFLGGAAEPDHGRSSTAASSTVEITRRARRDADRDGRARSTRASSRRSWCERSGERGLGGQVPCCDSRWR